MADEVGSNLAFLLMGSRVPGYAPPENLEFCSDDVHDSPESASRGRGGSGADWQTITEEWCGDALSAVDSGRAAVAGIDGSGTTAS
jgi:hypothetical protein